jgi:hypothetical protein
MFEFSSLSSPSSGSALLQHIPDSSRIESQPSVSLKVIPDVDPHRAVETTDNQPEDDYSGLMEDGLGHDDDDFIDDDEHHDVGVTNTGSRERFALPPWLADAFKARLEEANNRGGDGLPKLYSVQKTFWFPQQSSYFLLRGTSLSPQDLYNPRFFLWDPECLLVGGIGCPKCGVKLHRHGYASRPRRVVGLNETFWIIGYRYRCDTCVNISGKKTVTFRSWDSRIIEKLPVDLVLEFPAQLSHRSGITLSAFHFMRSCFQNGMGAKQFSDSLRVQHLRRHDELHLQYLHAIQARQGISKWKDQTYAVFLPFEDQSPLGRHGFVPSSQWLRDIYDNFIEKHEMDFNQHTAMLSGEICALDHSHKITQEIMKVHGKLIWVGLLTVTNQKAEVRVCDLVATKSHSQFEFALKQMKESLKLYGHLQPKIFYTDNVWGDKQFLEESFESLRQDVVPVEKYSHLEPLEIPSDIQVVLKNGATAIADVARIIVDSLPDDDNATITIGFDSERNVSFHLAPSDKGKQKEQAGTAVVTLGHHKHIYILQIGGLLQAGKLPVEFAHMLADGRVKKVGRMISADLKYLQKEMASD